MKIKKSIAWLLAVTFVVAFLVTGCTEKPATTNPPPAGGGQTETPPPAGGGDPAQTPVELTFHHHDPPASAAGTFFDRWANELREASGGLVDVTVYPGATLGPANTTTDMVLNGTVDIGWGVPSYFPGAFPMSDVFYLPNLGLGDAVKASEVYWKLFTDTDYLDAEYADYTVLFLHCHADLPIASTKNKPVENPADLAGLKVRVTGSIPTEFLKELGMSPVAMPAPEAYTSLEKGVVDSILGDWHLLKSFNITDLLTNYLDCKVYEGPLFVVMNTDIYNSLPDYARGYIDEFSGVEWAIAAGENWQNTRDETIEIAKSRGAQFFEVNAEMQAAIDKAAEIVTAKWISDHEANGLPAQAVYDFVIAEAAK